MGYGREGHRERAFLMDGALDLVPREQDGPGMLANLSRRFEGEGLGFVHRLLKRREFTRGDDLVCQP